MREMRCLWLIGVVLGVVLGVVGSSVGSVRAEEGRKASVDPTGTWTWERTRGDRLIKSTLTLKLEGDRVTGTYVGGRGNEVKIENGKLEGDRLSFQYTREFNDREFTIRYEGKISGGTIKGTLAFGDGDRTREWEAKRVLGITDLLGLWKFKSERDNGEPVETSLRITKDGDELKGIYTSPWRDLETRKITLEGDELSFELSGESDNGDEWLVKYKGKVSGSEVKGLASWKFGDREGSREFVGRREAKKAVDVADVLGAWKLAVSRENGETRESSIAITAVDGKLKGAYTSQYGEREAGKVTLKDGVLSFELAGETDNGDFLFVFKGKVSGDAIKGTVSFRFGDREGTREFEGRRSPNEDDEKKESRQVRL